jgi:hypothetical protein
MAEVTAPAEVATAATATVAEAVAVAAAEVAVVCSPTTTTTATATITNNNNYDENYNSAFAVLNKRVPIRNTEKQQLLLDFAQLDIFPGDHGGESDSTAQQNIVNIYKLLPQERPSITILNKNWQKDFTATNIASLYSNWKILKQEVESRRRALILRGIQKEDDKEDEDDAMIFKFFNDLEKMLDDYIITKKAQDKFEQLKKENKNKIKNKRKNNANIPHQTDEMIQQQIIDTVAARKKPRLPINDSNNINSGSGNGNGNTSTSIIGQVSTLPVSTATATATVPVTTSTTANTRTRITSNNTRTKAIVFENDNDDIETVICPCDGINDNTYLIDVMKISQRNCSTIFTHVDDAKLKKRFKMEIHLNTPSNNTMNSMNIPISINNAKRLTVYDLFNFGTNDNNHNNSNGSSSTSSTSSSNNSNNNNGYSCYSMCKIKIITGGFSDNTTL